MPGAGQLPDRKSSTVQSVRTSPPVIEALGASPALQSGHRAIAPGAASTASMLSVYRVQVHKKQSTTRLCLCHCIPPPNMSKYRHGDSRHLGPDFGRPTRPSETRRYLRPSSPPLRYQPQLGSSINHYETMEPVPDAANN